MIVKVGTYTHNSKGGHGSASAYLTIRQYGKVVSIQGYIANLGAIQTNGLYGGSLTLGTFSQISLPPDVIRTSLFISNNAWTFGTEYYAAIATNGNINVDISSNIEGGKTAHLSIVYIANN